jgi:hypothetical protein
MKQTILRTISLIIALALTFGSYSSGQAQSKTADILTNTLPADGNLVLNPGFEAAGSNAADAADWTEGTNHARASDKFHTGGWSLHSTFRGAGTDTRTTVPIAVNPNTTYTYSGYIWRMNSTGGACLDMNDLAGERQLCATTSGSWQFVSGTWDSGSNTSVTLRLITDGSPTGDIWFDDIALVGTGGPIATPTNTLVIPTNTATVVTATSTLPAATPTTLLPTATSTTVSIPPAAYPSGGMWIPSSELMSLPTSGAAWDKMRSTAYGSWGTADLTNQDNPHALSTLAGALVYARTGDSALRSKVRSAIIAAKRTLDASSEWQTVNGVLAAGRQIGAYVIAADLINLKSFDPTADKEFRTWLAAIRTNNIGTNGRWKAITYTCENAAANWATFACASRIAASIYLGDTADVDRAASIIRAILGERSAYPANAPGDNGYFEHTADYQGSWSCNGTTWTGINPACAKSGVNLDGTLVEDASRGGGCCTLQGKGIMYSWEALQGLFVSAELLYRTGRYGNPYDWSNKALKRSLDFMKRSGWGITNVASYIPWLANKRYGTSYTQPAAGTGRIMGWGNWLYQN